jgi:hypothetical protein
MCWKFCSSAAQEKQQLYSWAGRCSSSFFSYSPWLSGHKFPRSMDWKWTNCVSPRSLDLTPLGFFFSLGLCETPDGLKARVTAAIASFTNGTLQLVWQEVDCRWDILYAELQIALIVEVFHLTTISLACKRNYFDGRIHYCKLHPHISLRS